MPRRHRAARDRAAPPEPLERPLGVAPIWAQTDWATAREVTGKKAYRCPGCHQEIRAGIRHLVVVEHDDVEGRRHWHTECWRRELRRQGYQV
jgi:hypothetical protein